MLKQLKKKFKKRIKKKKFRKTLFRVQKLFNTTFSYYSKKFVLIHKLLNSTKLKAILRVTANNIFCTILQKPENKLIYVGSVGKYKLKSSQRMMKFTLKTIVKLFYNKINTLLTKEINSIFIELVAPLKVRRFLIKGLSFFKKKKKNIIISIKPKKCFNGCVPPKKIRKRKRKMRILK
jgi:ribosomal protein S11